MISTPSLPVSTAGHARRLPMRLRLMTLRPESSTASTHRSLLEDLALLTEDPVLASQAPELLALVGGQALTLA